jgi:hypothetical protein
MNYNNFKNISKIDKIFIILYVILIITIIIFIDIHYIRKDLVNLYIYKSNIHGDGLYTNKKIFKGEIISLMINNDKTITYNGTKINHSFTPNTKLEKTKNGWEIIALQNINKYTELTVDYNDTPDFIKKAESNWK